MTPPRPGSLSFSTASLADHTLEEAVRIGGELGFEGIELLAFDGYRHSQGRLAGFYFDRMTTVERDALRGLMASFRHVSTHAPCIDIARFAPNPGVRGEARRQTAVAIGATAVPDAYSLTPSPAAASRAASSERDVISSSGCSLRPSHKAVASASWFLKCPSRSNENARL